MSKSSNVKDLVGSFEKTERAIALSLSRVYHSILDMISKAEQEAVPSQERLAVLLQDLKSFHEYQRLQTVWKRSIKDCKNEASAFSRAIINFIKVNLDSNSSALDELLGLNVSSTNSVGGSLCFVWSNFSCLD